MPGEATWSPLLYSILGMSPPLDAAYIEGLPKGGVEGIAISGGELAIDSKQHSESGGVWRSESSVC